jgi:hypothetical protein
MISNASAPEPSGVLKNRDLVSRLNVGARDIASLLRRNIERGDRVLEIGCGPGAHLLRCALIA